MGNDFVKLRPHVISIGQNLNRERTSSLEGHLNYPKIRHFIGKE